MPTHSVHLKVSGQTVALEDGDYILEGLESLGISMESDCRNGVCGACVTLCSGKVEWATEQHCLSDFDKDQGYILSCICKIRGPLTLDE